MSIDGIIYRIWDEEIPSSQLNIGRHEAYVLPSCGTSFELFLFRKVRIILSLDFVKYSICSEKFRPILVKLSQADLSTTTKGVTKPFFRIWSS